MGTHPPHWRVPLAQGRRRLGCHSALSRNRPQLVDRNVRELPKGDRHPVKVLVALDEFASLGKCSVLANAFSYVAGYGLRLLPAFQSIEQIQGVYGDKVAADIERNCAVRLVLRPAGLSDAKKISEQLGTYTFRARSRSMGTWGGGGARTRSPISLGR